MKGRIGFKPAIALWFSIARDGSFVGENQWRVTGTQLHAIGLPHCRHWWVTPYAAHRSLPSSHRQTATSRLQTPIPRPTISCRVLAGFPLYQFHIHKCSQKNSFQRLMHKGWKLFWLADSNPWCFSGGPRCKPGCERGGKVLVLLS